MDWDTWRPCENRTCTCGPGSPSMATLAIRLHPIVPGDNGKGKEIKLIFTYTDFQLLDNLTLKLAYHGHFGV